MEEKREERKWVIRKSEFVGEMKKEGLIAAPMVAVGVLQYLLQVVSVVMVGHLGDLSLSSVAIATSLTNVTGFSLLVSTFFYNSSVPLQLCISFVLQFKTFNLVSLILQSIYNYVDKQDESMIFFGYFLLSIYICFIFLHEVIKF